MKIERMGEEREDRRDKGRDARILSADGRERREGMVGTEEEDEEEAEDGLLL